MSEGCFGGGVGVGIFMFLFIVVCGVRSGVSIGVRVHVVVCVCAGVGNAGCSEVGIGTVGVVGGIGSGVGARGDIVMGVLISG